MTRYLLESRKVIVGEGDKIAIGWELTFYNDVLGVVEKTTASEDDTIIQKEPENTQEQNVMPTEVESSVI